jgi:ABC-2 type transport system ATP-binding protein
MWSYIKDLNAKEEVTVFVTTHYMEEAERMAHRVAVIDHGKIIALGTAASLKKETNTANLEDAFLALTGRTIRPEQTSRSEDMRMHARAWGRR